MALVPHGLSCRAVTAKLNLRIARSHIPNPSRVDEIRAAREDD